MCNHCPNGREGSRQNFSQTEKPGAVARLCLILIEGYRYLISPLYPPTCRYIPTCSQYAADAITKYGFFRGLFLAVLRLLRCHPFSRGGYDPVK
ncbi:MAG: membrane protein insertion efficiency factor YidD [Desulfobulbaceae bacterium]|nr:membrane protein insertion efficiency factor YidD [Desulfobulbaceae bacterium]